MQLLAAVDDVWTEAQEELEPGEDIDFGEVLDQVLADLAPEEAPVFTGENLPLADYTAGASFAIPGGVDPEWKKVTPVEALKWWAERKGVTASQFKKLNDTAKGYAFTIANTESQYVIDTAKGQLQRVFTEGITEREFKKRMNEAFAKAGLTGLKPWHLQAVYRQNVLTAYGAGRRAAQISPGVMKYLPFLEYRATLDGHERPEHRELHGTCLPADDPWWNQYYPPWDWGCRCRARSRRKPPRSTGSGQAPGAVTDPATIRRPPVRKGFDQGDPRQTWKQGHRLRQVDHRSITKSMNAVPENLKPFLDFPTAEEYRQEKVKLYQTLDGKAGYGLAEDGNLKSVHSNEPGHGPKVVNDAIHRGADHLDCIEGYLSEDFYPKFGFEFAEKAKWDREYGPPPHLIDGRDPDIIFMRLKQDKKDV